MFEIRKPTSSNKTIRMPDNLIEKLEHLAAINDISFNQLLFSAASTRLKTWAMTRKILDSLRVL